MSVLVNCCGPPCVTAVKQSFSKDSAQDDMNIVGTTDSISSSSLYDGDFLDDDSDDDGILADSTNKSKNSNPSRPSPTPFSYTKKVIVFGATGPVGRQLLETLCQEYPTWRIVAATRDRQRKKKKRNFKQRKLHNVKKVKVDVTKLDSVLKATKSCDIIFSCLGLHKHSRRYWARHWPVILENMLMATGSTKRLVFCDDLLAYGADDEKDVSPNGSEPLRGSLRNKPEIRALLRSMMKQYMTQYPGTLTVIGASDLFGPYVTDAVMMRSIVDPVVRYEAPLLVRPTVLHDFCYVPDLAFALSVAAVRDRAYDKFWIAPHSIHKKSLQDVCNMVGAARDAESASSALSLSSSVKVRVHGSFWWHMASWVSRSIAEVVAFWPFWAYNYTVDDADFVQEFGVKATPCDEALRATVDFQKQLHKIL